MVVLGIILGKGRPGVVNMEGLQKDDSDGSGGG